MSQIVAVTLNNLRALPARWGIAIVIIIGVAGVVAVLTSVMTMSLGLTATASSTARDGWTIVLRKGAFGETVSSIPMSSLVAIESTAGIARDENNVRRLERHYVTSISIPRADDPTITGAVIIRGLEEQSLDQRFRLIDGRMFESGKSELIVGKLTNAAHLDMNIGDTITTKGTTWRIVGVFEYANSSLESELFGDLTTVMAGNQSTAYSSVRVQLHPDVTIDEFNESLESDPRLKVEAKLESDYFDGANTGALLTAIAYVVGSIMAVGATFGALNVMYTAVSTRTREIATLRALGFGPLAVAISVLVEAMVLAMVGGAVGLIVTAILFHGSTFTTGTVSSISTVMQVTPELMGIGFTWGAIMGLLGGLIPSIGAARHSIVDGLRG